MFDRLENGLLAIAGACILGLCGLITVTVLTRSVLGWGVPDDVVIVKELMIGAIVLPLAAVSSARAHIAIEFLFNRFGRKTKAWLTAFGTVFALIALVPITYAAWRELAHVVQIDAYYFGELSLPKWPGSLAFFVGITFFAIRMCLLSVHDFRVAFRGGETIQKSKA